MFVAFKRGFQYRKPLLVSCIGQGHQSKSFKMNENVELEDK